MFDFLFKPKNYQNILGNKCYFLLKEFKICCHIDYFNSTKKWNELMQTKPSFVCTFFIYKKWIRKATIEEILSILSISDIKECLKKHNIKTSNKKSILIERIKEANLLKEFRKYEKQPFYIITEEGNKLVEEFLLKYEQDEIDIINKLENLLDNNKYKDAIDFASYYIDNRYFIESPVKGFIYFDKTEKKEILEKVKDIMLSDLSIFSALNKKEYKKLKIYTVISYLLGFNYKNNPLIKNYGEFNFKYSLQDCFELLEQYAYNQVQIRECKNEKDIDLILHVSSGCSEPCQSYIDKYKDKYFRPKNAPELPNPECENPSGCRCMLRTKICR